MAWTARASAALFASRCGADEERRGTWGIKCRKNSSHANCRPLHRGRRELPARARSVAFLLHYVSEMGNRHVEGMAAHGLGHVLETCAADIARTKRHRELTQPEKP